MLIASLGARVGLEVGVADIARLGVTLVKMVIGKLVGEGTKAEVASEGISVESDGGAVGAFV